MLSLLVQTLEHTKCDFNLQEITSSHHFFITFHRFRLQNHPSQVQKPAMELKVVQELE